MLSKAMCDVSFAKEVLLAEAGAIECQRLRHDFVIHTHGCGGLHLITHTHVRNELATRAQSVTHSDRWLDIALNKQDYTLHLLNIRMSPDVRDTWTATINDLDIYMAQMTACDVLIMAGDINTDLADIGNLRSMRRRPVEQLQALLRVAQLSRPQPGQPTWRVWSEHDPSNQLDYIFAGRNTLRECDEALASDVPGKKSDRLPVYSVLKLDGMSWSQKGQQSKYKWKPLNENSNNTQVDAALQHDKPKSPSEFVHILDKLCRRRATNAAENKKVYASCGTSCGSFDACGTTPSMCPPPTSTSQRSVVDVRIARPPAKHSLTMNPAEPTKISHHQKDDSSNDGSCGGSASTLCRASQWAGTRRHFVPTPADVDSDRPGSATILSTASSRRTSVSNG